MVASLVDMQMGQSGIVVGFRGGGGMARNLTALGIRLGKRVGKVSSMLMNGPVVVEVDGMRIAVGFGMARRIAVEVEG